MGLGTMRPTDETADAPSQIAYSQSNIIGQVESHSDPLVFSSNSGNALIVGGNWNNGANAGLSYLNNGNVDGNSNNGSRLDRTREIEFFTVTTTSPLGTVETKQIWPVPRAKVHGGTVRFGLKAKVVS